jgi:signal transduction histidine kinase/CheY-like chemotaxis protein
LSYSILTVTIQYEHDVVLARQRARQIAALVGFDNQDQTRLATAVSELARNAFAYAGAGKVEFQIEGRTVPQLFLVRISDRGPGIANLKSILDGRYRSQTGMGLGIIGARRLVDQCDVKSELGRGTIILLKKILPRHAALITNDSLPGLVDSLTEQRPQGALQEVQQQNQELVRALAELREHQDELANTNRELEDTNRGVVALYAELDEKASHLRRADEMKSRFLSNMSHEFRTPLNSILALSGLLLERADGELTAEQEKQVGFIRTGAEALLELVNDLLDLAKIEAGKVEVQPVEFEISNLFSALRGMLRPLLISRTVHLVFEDPSGIPALYGDEGKLSQILRNFISNALKFTERGVIRVSATLNEADQTVTFAVADTGPGIAKEDQPRIFEEFIQLDNPAQRNIKGTGLGLPLCRKLATLLEGRIDLVSALGTGSAFSVTVPIHYTSMLPLITESRQDLVQPEDARAPVLVLEDVDATRLLYENFLRESPFRLVGATSLREARAAMRQLRPQAIILDILLRGEDTWSWLAELKSTNETRDIPVVVITSVEDERKGLTMGADAYCVKPVGRERFLSVLHNVTRGGESSSERLPETAIKQETEQIALRVVVIDDEPAARYVIKRLLKGHPCVFDEAENGADGVRLIRRTLPDLVFLDLQMPDLSGYDVLKQIKADPVTRAIPIAIVTSALISEQERLELQPQTCAIINKSDLSLDGIGHLLGAVLLQDGSPVTA